MTDNPYPLWRQARCEHCAAGAVLVGRSHWIGEGYSRSPFQCTAPTKAEYIAELEREIAELRADSRLLDWLEKATVEQKVYIDHFGWIPLDRDSIRAAMKDERKGGAA